MGNLCCCVARIAPTNIFTAGEIDDISHQLELFFERVVPRTPRGTLDVDRCEREAVWTREHAEKAADDVVGAVEASLCNMVDDGDGNMVEKASKGEEVDSGAGAVVEKASPDAVEAPAAEKAAADADIATTPSEAEPMKVLQSIWDASAVATVARGDLRFMPFFEDFDPSKLVQLRTLTGHSGGVRSVAISPDGRRVVSGSGDKTLKVWNVATGECLATLEGHSSPVNCVAMFPDGRRVVSASHDGTLKVWDVATGKCVATLKGHSGTVYSVAVFPDGRRVVSASDDNTLKVWDVATGKCVATLQGHSSRVAVFPDGRRVVSGSQDKTLKVWGLPES